MDVQKPKDLLYGFWTEILRNRVQGFSISPCSKCLATPEWNSGKQKAVPATVMNSDSQWFTYIGSLEASETTPEITRICVHVDMLWHAQSKKVQRCAKVQGKVQDDVCNGASIANEALPRTSPGWLPLSIHLSDSVKMTPIGCNDF